MTASTVLPAVVTLPASRRVVVLRVVPRAELEQAGCDLVRLWLYTVRWHNWFDRLLRQTLLPHGVRPVVVDRQRDVVSEDQVYSGAIPWRDKAYVVERHWVLLQPLPEFVRQYWGDDELDDDEPDDEGAPAPPARRRRS
jgi:hypothetical protein